MGGVGWIVIESPETVVNKMGFVCFPPPSPETVVNKMGFVCSPPVSSARKQNGWGCSGFITTSSAPWSARACNTDAQIMGFVQWPTSTRPMHLLWVLILK